MRRSSRRAARASAAALLAAGCQAFAPAPAPFAPEPGFASGFVFEDRDGDGRRGAGEPGIADVAVSNGREVVRSDAAGRYRLAVDDDTLLFVVKPSGFRTALSPEQVPRFSVARPPPSVDFALLAQPEPTPFRAIVFGDTQPRDLEQIDFLARDVIAGLEPRAAAFGVTLGDLVHDDLALLEPLDRLIARVGVPWYRVLGNHDLDFDAPDDAGSTATFERRYGPATYAFEYADTHFLVLDDVVYGGPVPGSSEGSNYRGGFSPGALAFVRAYLALVPRDELVVALMHIPLAGPPPFDGFPQAKELLALLAGHPHTLSLSAHTHMQYQAFLGPESGFEAEPHLHANLGAVAGSWWLGSKDELGLPHATMRCGAPNGWWTLEVDGVRFRLRFQAARRPESHQMSIFAPGAVRSADAPATEVLVNVFAGSARSRVELRVGDTGAWQALERVERPDPFYVELFAREAAIGAPRGRQLPPPVPSLHLWRGTLPAGLAPGTHVLEVRSKDVFGQRASGRRPLRIE